jgi:predicted DNA-binding transcriptional regulator AlpA
MIPNNASQRRHCTPMSEPNFPNKMLTSRSLCERYGVVAKTLDRWVQAGILPQPMWINRRRYWDVKDVETFDRDRMKMESAA